MSLGSLELGDNLCRFRSELLSSSFFLSTLWSPSSSLLKELQELEPNVNLFVYFCSTNMTSSTKMLYDFFNFDRRYCGTLYLLSVLSPWLYPTFSRVSADYKGLQLFSTVWNLKKDIFRWLYKLYPESRADTWAGFVFLIVFSLKKTDYQSNHQSKLLELFVWIHLYRGSLDELLHFLAYRRVQSDAAFEAFWQALLAEAFAAAETS